MNQSYRVLWSSVRKCFVVVNEKSKSKGKPSSSHKAIAVAVASLFLTPGLAAAACSSPTSVTTALTDGQCYSNQNVTISPTGSINAVNDGMTAAIQIPVDPYNRTLINNGSLNVAASSSDATVLSDYNYAYAYAYANPASAVGIVFGGAMDGDLNNTGSIKSLAISGSEATSTVTSDASDGTDYAYAYAYMSGAYAAGIAIADDFNGSIDNTGTIDASASASAAGDATVTVADSSGDYAAAYSGASAYAAAYGIYIQSYMNNGAVLDNRGAINASADSNSVNSASASSYDYAYAYSSAQAYAGAYGILVEGLVGATINNHGTINANAESSSTSSARGLSDDADAFARTNAYATAYGISIDEGLIDGASLNNHGTINVTATGIANGEAIGSSEDVRAQSSGDGNAIGIALGGTYNGTHNISLDGSLRNDGTIRATANGSGNTVVSASNEYDYAYAYANADGDADASGAYLDGYFNSGASFINNGSITAISNADSSGIAHASVSDDYTYAYAYSGASASAYAAGIEIGGGLYDNAILTNNGDINVIANANPDANAMANTDSSDGGAVAYAESTAYARAYGLMMRAFAAPVLDEGASLNNHGSISVIANANPIASASATGDNSYSDAYAYAYAYASGIYLRGDIASGASLNNSGSISVIANANATASNAYSYAYAYGIVLDGDLAAGASINNSGTISAVANGGYGAAIGINFEDNLDGTLTNSGTISAKGLNGVPGSNLYSIYASDGSGTIRNMAGGLLDGQLYAGDNINVNNAGVINTYLQGSFIGGNYTQSASGALTIDAIDTATYGGLYTNGTATLAGGTNIRVALDPNHTLVANDTLTNVIQAGTLSMSSANVLDNNLALNFAAIDNGANGVDLTAASTGLTTVTAAVQGAGLSSAAGVAGVLDNLLGSINDLPLEFSNFLYGLGSSETQQEVADAASQLLPLISGGMTQTTLSALHNSNRIVQERQETNVGRSSGDPLFSDKHFWFKPFGSWADQDDRSGTSGYSAKTYGIVFGADGELSDVNHVGVAFSYARSDVDGNSRAADQNADIKSYQGIVYGSYILSPATDISYQFDIGRHDNEGRRGIAGVGTARADYGSWSIHAGAGLAHTISLNEKTNFIPSIRADYSWIYDESYTEKGAGAIGLNVNNNKTEELIFAVDGKLVHAVTEKATVTANLGVGYDVINERASLTSAFAGAPGLAFTTKGIDPSPWLARGGLGVTMNSTETVELSARYDFEVREDFDNQTASVKVRWAF